jgi:Raf kinase inhibitor-like YbhB/YbcL family protein
MRLTSSGFKEGGMIPESYARDGRNVSPPLAWDGAPKNTKSFALIVDDPDAPSGNFVHWLVYNIPADTTKLKEGVPTSEKLPNGLRQGQNDFGEIGYGGPQPPRGTHRYLFHLYALDSEIPLPPGARRDQIDEAIRQHILDECQLDGKYTHH